MPANIESAFMAKTAAWWGQDVLTDDTITTADALKAARLDWTVGKRPLFTVGADGAHVEITGRYAVVRDSDHSTLGVVADEYQCIQNLSNFDFLDGIIDFAKWESAGSLRGGKRVWALLNVKDSDIDMGGGDVVRPYILTTNTHDGSGRMIAKWVTRRVVCENTLDAALGERTFHVGIRHSGDVSHKMAVAQRLFAASTEAFAKFGKMAHVLQDTKISRETYDVIVAQLFPEPVADANGAVSARAKTMRDNNLLLLTAAIREEVKLLLQFTQTSGGVNAWMLLNGFTRFADHAQKVQVRGRDLTEVRFEHGLLGGGDDFKNKAAHAILAATGAKL